MCHVYLNIHSLNFKMYCENCGAMMESKGVSSTEMVSGSSLDSDGRKHIYNENNCVEKFKCKKCQD
jgi:hypothetical protein